MNGIILQISSLFIIFLITIIYAENDKIGLNSETSFSSIIIASIINISLNLILTIIYDNIEQGVNIVSLNFLCKTYLVSLIVECCAISMYVSRLIYNNDNFVKKSCTDAAIVIASILFTYIFSIEQYSDTHTVFVSGPSETITYVACTIYLLSVFIETIIVNSILPNKAGRIIRTCILILLAASVIQVVNNRITVVCIAESLIIFILYVQLENPESNIDTDTGIFNTHSLYKYINQIISNNRQLYMLYIAIENNNSLGYVDNITIKSIVNKLRFFKKKTKIFKGNESSIAVLFKDGNSLNEALSYLSEQFSETFIIKIDEQDIVIKTRFIIVDNRAKFESANEMFDIIKHISNNKSDGNTRTVVISDAIVNNYKKSIKARYMIEEALKDKRIKLYYQPIYSLSTNHFESAEALVRIVGKQGEIIAPSEFIKIAEETGLINALGIIVFEEVCKMLKKFDITKLGMSYIEVNLSMIQCDDLELANKYIEIMTKYNIDPSLINLEITESAASTTKDALMSNMNRLIDYGVSFSLDDFGNGQSNLNYIVGMPIKIVKFDKDMTQAYFTDTKALYVMNAAIDMITTMNLHIVSEGIETKTQLDELKSLGNIEYIQGYYFSHPLPESEFIEFISNNNKDFIIHGGEKEDEI